MTKIRMKKFAVGCALGDWVIGTLGYREIGLLGHWLIGISFGDSGFVIVSRENLCHGRRACGFRIRKQPWANRGQDAHHTFSMLCIRIYNHQRV
jgi:hypothetical protein